MTLRVEGGEARGRHLLAPRGIRPTQGVVRAAIFNVLGGMAGGNVLDLFAGSGALGIEALSRGAASATFVEKSEPGVRVLRQNLEALALMDRATVVRSDALRWINAQAERVAAADVVFLDPPYDDPALLRALVALDGRVGDAATVVAEHSHRQVLPGLTRLAQGWHRRYGDTELTILTIQT